jgi:hypothetical protein
MKPVKKKRRAKCKVHKWRLPANYGGMGDWVCRVCGTLGPRDKQGRHWSAGLP